MKKKIIIIVLIALGVIGLGIGGFFLVKSLTEKNDDSSSSSENKENIVSTIILDINPSLKISLDKDDKVIKMEALNDDAKDIIYDNCNGQELDYVIYKIVSNLVNNGYTENKITILVSTDGEIETSKVEGMIKNEFTTKSIDGEIVVLEDVSDSSKEKAKEYNISESKASFIEEILESKSNLTFEELKDKSIDELNEIKNKPVEEKKEETKQEEKKTNTNTGTNNGNGGKTYTCTPPSDLKSTEWCDWLSKRPQSCEFYLDEVSSETMTPKVLAHLGLSSTYGLYGFYSSNAVYKGASYCRAYMSVITTKEAKIITYWDSHTGEFLSEKRESVPKFIMTEDQALDKGLQYYNLNKDDCNNCWVVPGVDRSGGPDEYYRFQVNMQMKDGKGYTVDFNAVTGSVEYTRIW